MTTKWKCEERLKARKGARYDLTERTAFRAGYSDGYYGHPQRPSDWPNAYGAGYNEGLNDAKA